MDESSREMGQESRGGMGTGRKAKKARKVVDGRRGRRRRGGEHVVDRDGELRAGPRATLVEARRRRVQALRLRPRTRSPYVPGRSPTRRHRRQIFLNFCSSPDLLVNHGYVLSMHHTSHFVRTLHPNHSSCKLLEPSPSVSYNHFRRDSSGPPPWTKRVFRNLPQNV